MSRLRTREEDIWSVAGSYGGTTYFTHSGPSYVEACIDDLGKSSDHPLILRRDSRAGGEVDWTNSGFRKVGQIGYDYPIPGDMDAQIGSWVSQFTAQKIAASTAPLKPATYSLTSILEFRDVPRMLKHAGDLLHGLSNPISLFGPKMVASTTLAWQFGWGPLFQDILKMLDFSKQVAARQRLLGELNSGKVVRRRVKFGSLKGSSYDPAKDLSTDWYIFIAPEWSLQWTAQAWATIHWQLSDLNQLGRKPSWNEAFNILYGIPLGEIPIQIWKALPWTWCIDWFAGISEALEVSRNLLTYSPSRINLMYRVDKEVFWGPLKPAPGQVFKGMQHRRTELNRSQPSVGDVTGIHLRIPFLDTYKLSVLSSLLVLRLLGRSS